VSGIAGRIARLLSRWQREAAEAPEPGLAPGAVPEPGPEPEWPPYPPPVEDTVPFTAGEEVRLRVLADRARDAGPGARAWGNRLADCLREEVPDLADTDLARAALAVLRFAEEAAGEQDGAEDLLLVLADALTGAPPALAAVELDLNLAQEGRWR
jgi:hypothetical protein